MYLVLAAAYLAAVVVFEILAVKGHAFSKTVATLLLFFGILAAGFLVFVGLVFSFAGAELNAYIAALAVFALLLFTVLNGIAWGYIKKRRVYLPVIIIFCAALILTGGFAAWRIRDRGIETVSDSARIRLDYQPREGSKVAVLDEPPNLLLAGDDLPILDGATALYPVYSAFAFALYPKDRLGAGSPVWCSTTDGAYRNLINGSADIVFAAEPSDEQKKAAEDAGLTLELTPIGKEGFVFFVNSKNPLDDITVEQIREIYSGEITEWSELGVKRLGNIRAFQREEGSGSQTALIKLMAGRGLAEAPIEDVVSGMDGIITKTADYKNYKNAIGYSFRFYSTEMVKNDKIKLLSVNGVYPSEENIRNGSYPLASEFYAVTAENSDPRCGEIIDWILSEQGAELIEKTGYTPIR